MERGSRFDGGKWRHGRFLANQGINQAIAFHSGEGYPSAMASLPFDEPTTFALNELHIRPIAPPLIDLARQCEPEARFAAKTSKPFQEA